MQYGTSSYPFCLQRTGLLPLSCAAKTFACPCVCSGLSYKCCCRLPSWILSWYHIDVPFASGVYLQETPGFLLHHSRKNSLSVWEMHVLGSRQLKNEPRFERLSSFLLGPLNRVALHLNGSVMKACLLLSWYSFKTSNLFGAFLSCGRRVGWIVRLSLLTTSLWSVQQSAPNIVFVTLTSCLSFLRTMT